MTGEYTAEDLRTIVSHVRAICDRVETAAETVDSEKLGSVLVEGAAEFKRGLRALVSFDEGLQASVRKRTVDDDISEIFTIAGGRGGRSKSSAKSPANPKAKAKKSNRGRAIGSRVARKKSS